MAFTSFDRQFGSARETAPDFPALVALLAAHQASQPTARLARRIESDENHTPAALESLVQLFVQRRGGHTSNNVSTAALRGSFNPSVPVSDIALTEKKGR